MMENAIEQIVTGENQSGNPFNKSDAILGSGVAGLGALIGGLVAGIPGVLVGAGGGTFVGTLARNVYNIGLKIIYISYANGTDFANDVTQEGRDQVMEMRDQAVVDVADQITHPHHASTANAGQQSEDEEKGPIRLREDVLAEIFDESTASETASFPFNDMEKSDSYCAVSDAMGSVGAFAKQSKSGLRRRRNGLSVDTTHTNDFESDSPRSRGGTPRASL